MLATGVCFSCFSANDQFLRLVGPETRDPDVYNSKSLEPGARLHSRNLFPELLRFPVLYKIGLILRFHKKKSVSWGRRPARSGTWQMGGLDSGSRMAARSDC